MECGCQVARVEVIRHDLVPVIVDGFLRIRLPGSSAETVGSELFQAEGTRAIDSKRINSVLWTFVNGEGHNHVAAFRVELRGHFDLIETFRLIEGLERLDTALVVAAPRKEMRLLDIDMLIQFVFIK